MHMLSEHPLSFKCLSLVGEENTICCQLMAVKAGLQPCALKCAGRDTISFLHRPVDGL